MSASRMHVSLAGHIQVIDYTPTEGDVGVPITVRINFYHPSPQQVYLRLVVGHKAIATSVQQIADTSLAKWQLDGVVPFIENLASDHVQISVQALDNEGIIDTVTCGQFAFWRPASRTDGPVRRRRANTTIPAPSRPSPTLTERKFTPKRIRANSLMRTRIDLPPSELEDLNVQTPLLDLATPLESMCVNWDHSEKAMGRRLVRFRKMVQGCKLTLHCEPVAQEDYTEAETVISCIYRAETNSFYVTSVDIIYLLEKLVNDEFPVEEKNRIRRNLEGLRPTTVSKHKPGVELFFQKIMEFPDPKPRNIEKDLKVFEWNLLGQALEKIIAKYSLYTSDSPSGSTQSSISLPGDPPLQTPSDVDSRFYQAPDLEPVTKFEPLQDSLLFSQSHHSSECPSPAEYANHVYSEYSLSGLHDFHSPHNGYQLGEPIDYQYLV